MIISRLPSGGGGGKKQDLNIFCQLDEPETKDGIWIKTSKKYKNIVEKEKLFEDDGSFSDVTTIPFSTRYAGCCGVYYKSKIYFFKLKYINGETYQAVYTYCNEEGWTKIIDQSHMPASADKAKAYVIKGKIWLVCYIRTTYSNYATFILTFDGETFTTVYSNSVSNPAAALVNNDVLLFPYDYSSTSAKSEVFVYSSKYNTVLRGANLSKLYDIYDYVTEYGDEIFYPAGSALTYMPNNGCIINTSARMDSYPTFCCDGTYYYIKSAYQIGGNGTVVPGDDISRITSITKEGAKITKILSTIIKRIDGVYSNVTKNYKSSTNVVVANGGFYVIGGIEGNLDGYSPTTYFDGSRQMYQYSHGTQKKIDANSIVLVKHIEGDSAKYSVNLISASLVKQSSFSFDDIVLTDDEGKVVFDAPIYYGDGTKWYSLKGN